MTCRKMQAGPSSKRGHQTNLSAFRNTSTLRLDRARLDDTSKQAHEKSLCCRLSIIRAAAAASSATVGPALRPCLRVRADGNPLYVLATGYPEYQITSGHPSPSLEAPQFSLISHARVLFSRFRLQQIARLGRGGEGVNRVRDPRGEACMVR